MLDDLDADDDVEGTPQGLDRGHIDGFRSDEADGLKVFMGFVRILGMEVGDGGDLGECAREVSVGGD